MHHPLKDVEVWRSLLLPKKIKIIITKNQHKKQKTIFFPAFLNTLVIWLMVFNVLAQYKLTTHLRGTVHCSFHDADHVREEGRPCLPDFSDVGTGR